MNDDHGSLDIAERDSSGDDPATVPVSPEPLLLDQITEVWRNVLGLRDVRPADDFLQLSCHSGPAARIVRTLRRTLGVDIQLRHLLDARDLAEFTESVRLAMDAGPIAPRPPLLPRRAHSAR
ncbi:phosphopantetheine-binding protein [Streptomyces sp. NPDC001068]|uniref:phosphopantetheine-binding protein n=1 Tax=Streptomyces sp. NPDC001068 TaxID=3364544 RepID=UPI003681311D